MAISGEAILEYMKGNDPDAYRDVRGLAGMVFDGDDGASDAAHARVCGFFARFFESGGDPDFDFSGPDGRQPADYAKAIRALEMASAKAVHDGNVALSLDECWTAMQRNVAHEITSGIRVIRICGKGRSEQDYAAVAACPGGSDQI